VCQHTFRPLRLSGKRIPSNQVVMALQEYCAAYLTQHSLNGVQAEEAEEGHGEPGARATLIPTHLDGRIGV